MLVAHLRACLGWIICRLFVQLQRARRRRIAVAVFLTFWWSRFIIIAFSLHIILNITPSLVHTVYSLLEHFLPLILNFFNLYYPKFHSTSWTRRLTAVSRNISILIMDKTQEFRLSWIVSSCLQSTTSEPLAVNMTLQMEMRAIGKTTEMVRQSLWRPTSISIN